MELRFSDRRGKAHLGEGLEIGRNLGRAMKAEDKERSLCRAIIRPGHMTCGHMNFNYVFRPINLTDHSLLPEHGLAAEEGIELLLRCPALVEALYLATKRCP
jgi:hypothetical protein